MPRVYKRKFDWDEARRLHRKGLGYTEIGRQLGVTDTAVRYALIPAERELMKRRAHEWQRSQVTCVDCGVAIIVGHERCVPCSAMARATGVRDDALRCVTCRKWKLDEEFPYNRGGRAARRGRHHQCRPCQTIARRDHRRRNREADNAYQREYKRRTRAAA